MGLVLAARGKLCRATWRRWCVGPVAVLLTWFAGVSAWRGPPPAWPETFHGEYVHRMIEAVLVLPGAALVAALVVWVVAGRRAGGRAARWLSVALVALLLAANLPLGRAGDRALSSGGVSEPVERRVDAVVLVVIDTLRADSLSCTGSSRVVTPTLDRLARRGVLWKNAISQSPWTVPSVASILTSRYPSVHGAGRVDKRLDAFPNATREGLSRDVPSVPEMLTRAGWTCAGVYTNAVLDPAFGFHRGFQTYVGPRGLMPGPVADETEDPTRVWRTDILRCARWESLLWRPVDCDSCHDRLALDRAAEWIECQPSRPFFLFVHLFGPHEYYRFYASTPGEDGQPRLLRVDQAAAVTRRELRAVPVRDRHADMDTGDLDVLRARYDANVMFDDALLTILTAALERRGLLDRTLFVVTSDHGEEFEEHGGRGHGHTLYDELLRVPLIMACPGQLPEGRVVTDPVRLIDVAPTILELAGVPPHARLNGRTLLETIGRGVSSERVAFCEFDERTKFEAVRTGEHKLIRRLEDGGVELYHLVDDPDERRSKTQPGDLVAADMTALHSTWREDMAKEREGVGRFIPEVNATLIEQMRLLGYMQE